MAKLISFEKALRRRIKEGDEVIINALYPAENETIRLHPDETGCKEEQLFSREQDLRFFYAKSTEGIPTFWGDATKAKLNLVGKLGATFAVIAVNKACKPWTNLEMGLYSRAATVDDYMYISNIVKPNHNLIDTTSWLGSQYVHTFEYSARFGVRYVADARYVFNNGLFYSSNLGECDNSDSLRPVIHVFLPSKIMVDMKKSKDGAWVLVPNNK